jgi:lauroyl/myristoyl acyltransferase
MENRSTQRNVAGLSKPRLLIASALSSLIYLLTSQVMKYRYKVIEKNLFASFGSFGDKNVKDTINKYYQHLGDLVIEPFLYYFASPGNRKKLAMNDANTSKTMCYICFLYLGNTMIIVARHFMSNGSKNTPTAPGAP